MPAGALPSIATEVPSLENQGWYICVFVVLYWCANWLWCTVVSLKRTNMEVPTEVQVFVLYSMYVLGNAYMYVVLNYKVIIDITYVLVLKIGCVFW